MANAFDQFDAPQTGNAFDQFDKPVVQKPTEKSFGQKAIEFLEPTAEALGTAGGALIGGTAGTFGAGPVGTAVGGAVGAGLGYGAAKEIGQNIKEKLGYEPVRTGKQLISQPIENVATGATYELGGQALPSILQGAGKLGASISNLLTRTPETRAAKIVSESLGPNLAQAREVLKSASSDLTASQLDQAGQPILTIPTTQALLKRAEARDPEFFVKMFGEQEAKRFKELEKIAGGANQTEAKQAREEMKDLLNKRLIPTLKNELSAANIAGQKLPKLEREAERMGKAATSKVEDVRRFTAAQPRATSLARKQLIEKGLPVGAEKYTYMGELSKKAEKVATDAAEGSLIFGEASRFANAAAQSLEAHGLKPLSGEQVINQISRKLQDPSLAGNEDVRNSLIKVAEDIRNWTNEGGVIDAFALDSIRKNSVNSAIQKMYPAASKQQQKQIASSVLENVRPTIIDAVEEAGGTGYRQYLQDYAKGSHDIAERKLGARALELYQKEPKSFLNLVRGNSPDEIEKVFGPGSYSIFKELASDSQSTLGKIARQLERESVIGEQAKAGTQRLADVLGTNLDFMRLPHWLSKGTTLTNDMISRLEGKVSRETLEAITKAGESAKSMEDLLSKLPPDSKNKASRVLYTPTSGATFMQLDRTKERD